jgi:hypothetical protein
MIHPIASERRLRLGEVAHRAEIPSARLSLAIWGLIELSQAERQRLVRLFRLPEGYIFWRPTLRDYKAVCQLAKEQAQEEPIIADGLGGGGSVPEVSS